MLLLDGTFYQIRADGKVYLPEPEVTTPFASVLFFRAERSFKVSGEPVNSKEMYRRIDAAAGNHNLFLAVKVSGVFSQMKTRSVPRQNKPYPPLVKVTANQPVFEFGKVNGTIVGFRLPPFVKGINVPGYHLHFIADDLGGGGHVLDFELEHGRVELAVSNLFYMILPGDDSKFGTVDLGVDRGEELMRVEK